MTLAQISVAVVLSGLLTSASGISAVKAADPVPFVTENGALAQAPWSLIFSDEFDGSSLAADKWATCYWWADSNCTNSGNKELQLYHSDALSLTEGALQLRATHAAKIGPKDRFYPYQSGIVTTARTYSEKGKDLRFSFQYGYAEIRARLPKGKGLWPAFWLLPETLKSRPEIDVMEMLGDSPHLLRMHVHYIDSASERQSLGQTLDVGDLTRDWHRFGLLWDERQLIWFLDGKEQWRVTESDAIPKERLYLLLNLAVGGEWPGFPDQDTKFPADYLIDYVRVWQKPD